MTSRMREGGVAEPVPKSSSLLTPLENYLEKMYITMASEIEALGNEPDKDTETEEHTNWLEKVRAVRVHRWYELTLYMQKDGCWEPLVKAIIEELETNMADWESIKFWCRAWLRMLDKYDDGSQLLAMSANLKLPENHGRAG